MLHNQSVDGRGVGVSIIAIKCAIKEVKAITLD